MENKYYDLIVIGGGIGGYTAAIKAAKKGKKTAIVEQDMLGGTCLNRGCIPTKELVYLAAEYDKIKKHTVEGIYQGNILINPLFIQERLIKNKERLRSGISYLLDKHNVEVIKGCAMFAGKNQINVLNENRMDSFQSENVIIATGSHPVSPMITGIDLPGVFTADSFLESNFQIPKELVIIGGGVIGIEMAFIFSKFGSQVSIVEKEKNILGINDSDLQRVLQAHLEKCGIELYLDTIIKEIIEDDDLNIVLQKNKETKIITCTNVMVAAGRASNIEDLCCESAGILLKNGKIEIDTQCRTSVEHIYAVGDVAGGRLAYTASMQAEIAIDNMCGILNKESVANIPYCIFADLEIAYIGNIIEKETISKVFPMYANGRSVIEDADGGFIKLFMNQGGFIVGAVLVCQHAAELIHCIEIALQREMQIEEIAELIYAHPTFAEAIGEAAKMMIGVSVNI